VARPITRVTLLVPGVPASAKREYAAQIQATGQPLTAAPEDRPEYGMREAAVRDPDGNDIYIGQTR